ncbi:MAG: cupin domain-containing protein [Rhodospirillales bacterium]
MSDSKAKNEFGIKADVTNCLFDFAGLAQHAIGDHYSTARGGIVEGDRIQVALVRKKPGTGSRLHTHPNEQFNYVLKGNLKVRVGDVESVAPPGTLIFIPANTPHYTVASDDGDVEYFAVKDTSHIMYGDPVDGKNTGAHYDPGFEPDKK